MVSRHIALFNITRSHLANIHTRHLAQLERGARHASNPDLRTPPEETESNIADTVDVRSSLTGAAAALPGNILPSFENTSPTENGPNEQPGTQIVPIGTRATTPDDPARLGIDLVAETEHDSCNRSATGDQHFTNPLVNGPPAFTADEFGQQCTLHLDLESYVIADLRLCSIPWNIIKLVFRQASAGHGS